MRTVLVVENDRPTHALLIAVARRSGFDATSAFDGPSALRHIREEAPDAILLDMFLPALNGFQILGELKRSAPEMLARVVVITAAVESLYRECEELQSVCAILRKPFDVGQLEDVLGQMMRKPAPLPKKKLRAGGTMRLKIG